MYEERQKYVDSCPAHSLAVLDHLQPLLEQPPLPILKGMKPLLPGDSRQALKDVPVSRQLAPGLVHVVVQVQAHLLPPLPRVQLGPDGRREHLDDADVPGPPGLLLRAAAQLGAQGPGEAVDCGLGGAVVGHQGHGDEGEAGGDHDDAGWVRAPGDEVWEEVGDDVDGGEVVGRHLVVDGVQRDGGRVSKVDGLLEACVEEDGI